MPALIGGAAIAVMAAAVTALCVRSSRKAEEFSRTKASLKTQSANS